MARIRTIKPEFWADEKLSLLSPITRLVFLGLISQADDAGRLVDNVKLLDGLLFPFTDDSCGESLDILAETGRIQRYRSSSGQALIQIVNWEKHQKVANPSKHTLPAPPGAEPEVNSRGSNETLMRPSVSDLLPTTTDHGPLTNDQRPTTGPAPGAAVAGRLAVGEIEEATAEVIAACNAGMAENARIPRYRSLSAKSAWNRRAVAELLSEGIPLELIRKRAYEGACAYEPDEENPQIRSIAYFMAKIRDEHRRQTAKPAAGAETARLPSADELAARQEAAEKKYSSWRERVLSRFQEEPDPVRAELEQAAKDFIGEDGLRAIPKNLWPRTIEAKTLELYGERIGDPQPQLKGAA